MKTLALIKKKAIALQAGCPEDLATIRRTSSLEEDMEDISQAIFHEHFKGAHAEESEEIVYDNYA